MIDIRFEPGKKVSIKGHAGYADRGHDIVCAAISTLYCTMIMSDGIAGTKDGDEMLAICMETSCEKTFNLFCAGMQEVARQYPTFCTFRREKMNLADY